MVRMCTNLMKIYSLDSRFRGNDVFISARMEHATTLI